MQTRRLPDWFQTAPLSASRRWRFDPWGFAGVVMLAASAAVTIMTVIAMTEWLL